MQCMGPPLNSLIVPVYKNEGSIFELISALDAMAAQLADPLEVVFVVDGSPDGSFALLEGALPHARFSAQLIALSRNFGAFAAIREGLRHARGEYFAVMAADLQEPPELARAFFETLASEPVDVVLGTRIARADPLLDRVASRLFWGLYRRFVQPEIPRGGVDMFGCNRAFREHLLKLEASNTSLVGQLVWLGFRRKTVPYSRVARRHGKGAWSFGRKLDYLLDSVFAFTDFPIRALLFTGAFGMLMSLIIGIAVLAARISGTLEVPGYAATVLLILFFAALNMFGLGIVGSYAYRAFENSKGRPAALVMSHAHFEGARLT